MISRVVGDKPLPANVRQDIIERTDGIPLFVDSLMARLDRLGPAQGASADREERQAANQEGNNA
jgi:hypothetical protein